MKTQSKPRKSRQAHAHSVIAQKPKILGWNTTDEDEIALRRWRGEIEPMTVQALETAHPIFGAFCVQSSSRQSYHVEIRHLSDLLNSCDCPDYQNNGLGTCKHIEKTLGYLRQNYRRQWPELEKSSSERVEIFLDQRDQKKMISILWPKSLHRRATVRRELENFFSSDHRLLEHPLQAWPKIRENLAHLQPFESLLGFYFIEIEIKQLVEVNDALSPYFRTLLGIWQKPAALKTPMTVTGLAAQHIDWGGTLSWMGLPTLSFLTPPSIKTFVYKPEYQGLVFSSELRDFLAPEITLKTDVAQVKGMAVQLLKTHEKLHTELLKEHGLTRHAQLEKKENRISSEGEDEEKDITLTFAESSIHQIDVYRKMDLAAAVKSMESALDDYLKKATERVSLATLARRIKGWYERTPEIVYPLQNLLSLSDPAIGGVMMMSESRSSVESTSTSVARPLSSGSASTSSTTSSMIGSVSRRPLTDSLPQTLVGGDTKKNQPSTGSSNQTKKSSAPMVLKTK